MLKTDSYPSFSERLQLRNALWWGKGPKAAQVPVHGRWLHRFEENHLLRRAADPEGRWRCCEYWHRALSNKWNAREFATRHGCRVPALYWWGRRPGAIPLDSLGDFFVVRRAWGTHSGGVFAMAGGRELLRRRSLERSQLRRQLRRSLGAFSHVPVLVEEFVRTEEGTYELPVNFKFHMFGDEIAAIHLVRHEPEVRPNGDDLLHRFYTASWTPIEDRMVTDYTLCEPQAPPRCLDEMIAVARRLGRAYGKYVRVDLYATDQGCVFGEFSTIPHAGRNYTPFAERYFGEFWQRAFPDET